jgi:serine/threonine-protein kinase RsbT
MAGECPEGATEVHRIPIKSELDIVTARVEGRGLAKEMGFGVIDQARIATAVSELARNVLLYAESGQIVLVRLEGQERTGLQIVCEDHGPGIRDIDHVLRDRSPAHQGLGMGLPGTKRLMDEFEISSEVGVGTIVRVCKWLR